MWTTSTESALIWSRFNRNFLLKTFYEPILQLQFSRCLMVVLELKRATTREWFNNLVYKMLSYKTMKSWPSLKTGDLLFWAHLTRSGGWVSKSKLSLQYGSHEIRITHQKKGYKGVLGDLQCESQINAYRRLNQDRKRLCRFRDSLGLFRLDW